VVSVAVTDCCVFVHFALKCIVECVLRFLYPSEMAGYLE
jgi:hypothetical protein